LNLNISQNFCFNYLCIWYSWYPFLNHILCIGLRRLKKCMIWIWLRRLKKCMIWICF